MSSINYNGNAVNDAVSELNNIINDFSSLSSSVRTATNKIISCRGFSEYVGGVSSDSFSSAVDECEVLVSELIKSIREKQINILAYSEDKDAINLFLDNLSNSEYNSLDLSSLSNYITIDRKAGNLFKGVGSTVATFGLGLVEGVMDFGETGADLITLGGSLFKSIFTGGYDLITGSDTTKQLWEETRAKVSEKKVESIFNNFYSDNPIGKSIKDNAYLFDGVRGVGKGLGYSAGIIGTSVLTGGLASGLGIGAAGSVGVANLAATAGVMGFSNGTEEAWADGATTGKGLLYGAASGAWEGAQWALGAKINQYGGLGDTVSKGIFKGAASGVGTRIAMDAVDSAAEGFVQPALTMIYKDYGADNIFDNYANAFKSMGGWGNVLMQGAIGGIGSAFGEFSGARKILKSANEGDVKTTQLADSAMDSDAKLQKLMDSPDEADAKLREIFATSSDDTYEVMSRVGSTHKTIDGLPVTKGNGNHEFNSNVLEKDSLDNFYVKSDGSFLPKDGVDITAYDEFIGFADRDSMIYKNRHNLSAASYTRLNAANKIFNDLGVPATINELKLISGYSCGNVNRISSLLSSYGVSDENLRNKLADKLSKELFLSGVGGATAYKINSVNSVIDKYIKAGMDSSWDSTDKIFSTMGLDKRLVRIKDFNYRRNALESLFGKGTFSESTMDQLVKCDGLPSSIRKILSADSNVSEKMIDYLTMDAATKVFADDFALNYNAALSFKKGNFSETLRLLGLDNTKLDEDNISLGYAKLFKAANEMDGHTSSKIYYSFYDKLVNDFNYDSKEARKKAADLFNGALFESGYTDRYIIPNLSDSRRSFLLNLDSVFNGCTDKRTFTTFGSSYMNEHYFVDGHYDLAALRKDFQMYAAESCSTASGLDLEANKFFFDTYFGGAMNPENQNSGEVYKAMAKLLELRDQNKNINIGCVATNGSSCNFAQNKMNIAVSTFKGENYEVVLHESGHLFFGKVLGEEVPTDFANIRQDVVRRLNSTAGREQVEILTDNIREIGEYVDAITDNTFERGLRGKKYSGVDEFREALIQKYTKLIGSDEKAVKKTLEDVIVNESSRTLGRVDISTKVNLADPADCADFHISMMKSRIRDHIMRNDFKDYSTISGMLDSVTQGDMLISYGHGATYFSKKPSKDLGSYHELIADYTKLKLSGNNHTIKYLRNLFGDELVDQLDRTYNDMLK